MKKMEDDGVCPHCGYDSDTPTSRSALEEGTLLQNGRYQLGAVLGMGGFGSTYAAWDYSLEQPVAIKEYYPQSFCERDVGESDVVSATEENKKPYLIGLARFSREARILGTLQNIKSVVAVHDWFEDNGTAYIVMEFVRGSTLEEYVHKEKVSPEKLIIMMRDLVDSLVAVHELGVLHRDISPTNLMVQENGDIKLIDFGAAVVEERRAAGKDQTVVFNRKFAPVEQYDQNGRQGPWTDVYALSATMYYLISGELPQEAMVRKAKDSLSSLRQKGIHLKKYQEKAILDGMIISPDKRIQSMDIFRSVLYHLPMPEEVKRRRKFMIQVGVAAGSVVAALALAMINSTWGFYLGNGIRYGLHMDGWHVLGYGGAVESLVIPENLLGIPVSEIENQAFGWSNGLKEVTIPGSVEKIDAQAFSGCEWLETVAIEDGNQSIDEYAFSDCPMLHTVILPGSTMRLAASAFHGCSDKLTVWCEDESLPQISMIGAGVNTASVKDYEVVKTEEGVAITNYMGVHSTYESKDAINIPDYIENQKVTDLEPTFLNQMPEEVTSIDFPEYIETFPFGIVNDLFYVQDISLGSELKLIEPFAFSGCGIKQLSLPETVESIGESAFSQSHLEEISIPDAVTDIGESAFASCTELSTIKLSNGMKQISAGMFEGCSSLMELILPNGLERIEMLAFGRCNSLESVQLPDTVQFIGAYAFSECTDLKIVRIPQATTEIVVNAFDGCPADMVIAGVSGSTAERYAEYAGFRFLAMDQWDMSSYGISNSGGLLVMEGTEEAAIVELPSVYSGSTNEVIYDLVDAKTLKAGVVHLPKYVEYVWGRAFANNNYLKELYTYEDLREIETMAFWRCKNMESVHLSEGIETIGSFAFAEDEQLKEVVLPDSIEEIGMNAFWRCKELTDITIPSSLTVLKDGCFSKTGITDVYIPGNVVKCRTAFYGCNSLKTATLAEGVKTLWGTFAQCDALETVVIPSTMKEISRSTFQGCSSLKDVWIYSKDVEMDFLWPAIAHVDEMEVENGNLVWNSISLEASKEDVPMLFTDSPDVVIHGYAGSTAEAYAKSQGIAFEVIE